MCANIWKLLFYVMQHSMVTSSLSSSLRHLLSVDTGGRTLSGDLQTPFLRISLIIDFPCSDQSSQPWRRLKFFQFMPFNLPCCVISKTVWHIFECCPWTRLMLPFFSPKPLSVWLLTSLLLKHPPSEAPARVPRGLAAP